MTDCVFCKIIAREIPSDKVYEDDSVLAFMDIKPVSRGHVLILPKKHSVDLLSTNEATLQDLVLKVKKVAQALKQATKADGMNISSNNGVASGQIIFHLHFHLIPRYTNDNLAGWPHHDSEPKTRSELAEEIKKNL